MGTTFTLALRYLTARREGAGLSIVPLLSGLGIMVGVATLVTVMSVFAGYREQILERLLSRTGHLVVTQPGFRTFDGAPVEAGLAGRDDLAAVQPVLLMQGLLLNGNQGAGVALQGMRAEAMRADETLAGALAAFEAAQGALDPLSTAVPSQSASASLSASGSSSGSSSAADELALALDGEGAARPAQALASGGGHALDFDALSALFAGDQSPGAAAEGPLSPLFLGRGLAASLNVGLGDDLRLVLAADEAERAAGTTAARSFGLSVAGIFSAGLFEADQAGAVAFLEDVQSWRNRPGEVSEIRLMLKDLGQRRAVAQSVQQGLPPGFLLSDRAQALFRDYEWVRAQGNAATLIVVVILIVAAFGIASGQLMMVQERQADIAILRGFGVQGGGILRIFLVAGLLVAVLGLVLGLGLGWWISVSLNDIRLGLEAILGRPLLNPEFYQIDELNGVVQPGGLVFVSLVTLLVSLMATLYPAWRASRVPPALVLKEV